MSVNKTKEIICSSFLKLTEKKKISDITITALCKKAGIARTTFYSHYDNISDVVRSLQNTYLDGIEKIMRNPKKTDINISDIVEYILYNYNIPKLFLIEQPDDLFIERFKSAAKKYLLEYNNLISIDDMRLSLISEMCKYYFNHMDCFDNSTMEEHVRLIDAIIN